MLTSRQKLTAIAFVVGTPLAIAAVAQGTPIPLLLVLATVAAVFIAYRAIGFVILKVIWRKPAVLLTEPVPDHWAVLVDRAVPLARHLGLEQRERLLKLVQLFVHEKRFEGAGGFAVTEEVQVTIAAHACLLLVNMPVGCYPNLKTVIVYEGAYRPHESHAEAGAGRIARPRAWRAGESWISGVVVVAWDSVRRGAINARDGDNVVLHEFAHQLDQEDGVADGVPGRLSPSSVRTWGEMIGRLHETLVTADRKGRRTVLRKYGATNEAEFFAVATEAFFEKGRTLKRRQPELYAALREFYALDPASWS